jgi:hypothetical protein
MKTTTKIGVAVSGLEFHELIQRNALEILKLTIPEIEHILSKDSIQIYLEKSELTFKTYFKVQIRSVVGGQVQKVIDSMLVYQSNSVISMIIDKVLAKQGIKKVVNLNTPTSNLKFELGDVLKDKDVVDATVVSFDMSLEYEDSNDYQ